MISNMIKSTLALSKYKTDISQYLINFLNQEQQSLKKISLEDDVYHTLKKFVVSGKMTRANLFILAYEIFEPQANSQNFKETLLPLAGALELIQAGLLIHDDIIDQDEKRRGQDSIWQYYSQENESSNQHYGESQAICLGNLCYFLANQLILQAINNSSLKLNKKQSFNIQQLINREISQVVLAEMLDSQLAIQKTPPKLKTILEMNLYKTARYSFSLPLMLAKHLSGNLKNIKQLSEIGEKIGLIFQIQDDYLGIFGDSKKTGKPILSDIKEGKKTIFHYHLVQNKALSKEDRELLNSCFGKQNIDQKKGLDIQKLFEKYSLQAVNKTIDQLNKEAEEMIKQLENKQIQKLLKDILNFVHHRQH
jgi:geranylgeranyl diphosphate synthase, type I